MNIHKGSGVTLMIDGVEVGSCSTVAFSFERLRTAAGDATKEFQQFGRGMRMSVNTDLTIKNNQAFFWWIQGNRPPRGLRAYK